MNKIIQELEKIVEEACAKESNSFGYGIWTHHIKHCIATHRASVPSEKRSPEAECLANADAMVHIEQVPSLLHYAFVQRGMGIDQGTAWVKNKLKRTWKKLSPQIQKMMWQKYKAALQTLTRARE